MNQGVSVGVALAGRFVRGIELPCARLDDTLMAYRSE